MENIDLEKAAASGTGTPERQHSHGVFYRDPTGNTHLVSQVPNPPYEKLGNPGPLGLFSFAVTTLMMGLYRCGAGLPHSNPNAGVGPDNAVLGSALFMGGIAQFAAGMWEIRVGNTFGGTLHTSFGAFWLSYSAFLLPFLGIAEAYKGDERALSFAIGIYLVSWGVLVLIFFLAALKTNWVIIITLGVLTIAFYILAISEFVSTTNEFASKCLNQTGGAMAVFCALGAFYAGATGLLVQETTFLAPLPVFKLRS